MVKSYENLKKISLKKGEVEFEAQISLKALEEKSAKILTHIRADFEMPGFRKGSAPEDIVRKHVNEMHIFEDAANEALRDGIKEIIIDENLPVIGMPEVVVTKIVLDNPVEFKVKFALSPEIELPDYKKIGSEISKREENTEVSEKEMQAAVERIQKIIALQKGQAKSLDDKESALPEINDEFVKQIGPFNNVEEFKEEVKKQLEEDKKMKSLQSKREEIINEVISKSKIEIPQLFLDQEFKIFVKKRDEDLEENKISFDDYLKEIKKTPEEFEKEERVLVERQIKTQFVLNEIKKKENLTADHEEIHRNEEFLKMRYPDRDHHYLHQMSEALILQEKLFDVLEGKTKDALESEKVEENSEPIAGVGDNK